MPWSIAWPSRCLKVRKEARRSGGTPPRTALAIERTAGPESRTTPIPARPCAVASAAMVSRATSSLGMGRLVAIEQALDLPLLQDRENVVHQPVKHQARGEE